MTQKEEQAKQDKINEESAKRESPVFHTHIIGGRGMKRSEFVKLDNELQDIAVSKSIPVNTEGGQNIQELSVVNGKVSYPQFQTIMSKPEVFKSDPAKYIAVLLSMSDGKQFTYSKPSVNYDNKMITKLLITQVKNRLEQLTSPLGISFVHFNADQTYPQLIEKVDEILKETRTKLGEIYKDEPQVRPQGGGMGGFGMGGQF